MIRTHRIFVLLFALAGFAGIASAQVPTGTPPFGSFAGGPDVINLANLNSHIAVPVLHKPGRSTNFTYDLSYDSAVWYPVTSGSTKVWQSVANFGWRGVTEIATGYVSYSTWQGQCFDDAHRLRNFTVRDTWVYHDPFGTEHSFPNLVLVLDGFGCSGITPVYSDTAVDGSGYSIAGATINSSRGTAITAPVNTTSGTGSFTDRNGNQITTDGNGHFYDTLSSTTSVLTVSGFGTPASPMTFTYTAPSGVAALYTMNYTTYTVKTNFGCSGVAEYGPTSVSLVDRITLPDGSFYQFNYEPTPGFPGAFTGRLASVTLPTGGTISYAYSGGGTGVNGINCSDGSAAGLTRTTPDGAWTYARTIGAGAASTTTITAPQLSYDTAANQTVIQFQRIYETQRDSYQGAVSPPNLLQTVNTCYNGAASPCTATAITLPIIQRAVIANLPGSGNQQSKHIDFFNTFGMPTETDDYDYATGAPGPLLRQNLITYASLGSNLNAFTQTVTVKDGGGVIKFRQDTNYDQYSSFTGASCITGAPQHDDTGHGCTFTARANLTSVTTYTDPATPAGGITKNFTYDSLGNLRTAQLNCCQQKQWNYSLTTKYAYPDSIVSGSSSPTLTTSATYDLNMGLVLTATDENNQVTTFAYDNLGRTTDVLRPDGKHVTYNYDDVNWIGKVIFPVQGTDTVTQKTFLDSQGRPFRQQVLDSASAIYSIVDTQYDALGRAYKVSNPYSTGTASYWTTQQFDALGRPTKTTLPAPDNSFVSSTFSDNTVTMTDPSGKQRKLQSDALGRLTSAFEPDVASGNALTQQTSYAYNALDKLTQVTQGVQTRTYVYDALGRVMSATTPEAGRVCFGSVTGTTCNADGYDSFNQLLKRTDARGVVTTYGYDALNRLSSIGYDVGTTGVPATAAVIYTYGTSAASNNNGRPVTMTDGAGSENYSYDVLGRATQLQKIINGTTYTMQYGYNDASELSSITYPSGRVVQQNYDVIGRLSSIASGATNYTSAYAYNPAGQVTGFNYGNGVVASLGYSADRLQMSSLSYTKEASTLFSLSYNYGAAGSNNGMITGITDSVDAGRSASYTYDALYRLKTAVTTGSASYPLWGLSWTYDRYGNRTAQTVTAGTGVPSNSITVDAATNRLTGTPYAYDTDGNMTNDGANTLTYDAESRAVTAAGATYTYDGNGLRLQKVSGATTTVYAFSGSKVIAEYVNGAAPASPTREYIYSGGALVANIEGAATNYYHQDHLSNRVVTDSSGNALAQLGHYPFGEAWYNATNDKLLFTTYERDSESGNDFAMARYDISRFGRFSSPDPIAGSIADPQSLNRYAYVFNDPMDWTDPWGLCGGPPGIVTATLGGNPIGGSGTIFSSEPCRAGSAAHTYIHCTYGVTNGTGFIVCNDPNDPNEGRGSSGSNTSGSNGAITSSNGSCIPSVFNPSCKPPSCLAVFVNAAGDADPLNLPAVPAGFGPDDAAKAAATALATKHIIERGLVVPLRSSIVRYILSAGEAAASAFVLVPLIIQEFAGLKAEYRARKAGTCTTAFSN